MVSEGRDRLTTEPTESRLRTRRRLGRAGPAGSGTELSALAGVSDAVVHHI